MTKMMKKTLLLLLMAVFTPICVNAKITLGRAAMPLADLLQFRTDSKVRRAMLEANGKEWFMKNVIMSTPDSMRVVIGFIEGDYCVANVKLKGRSRIEYLVGLKKAIDLLSENNDTLYQLGLTENPNAKARVWKWFAGPFINGYHNYDGFDLKISGRTPYFSPHLLVGDFSPRGLLRIISFLIG